MISAPDVARHVLQTQFDALHFRSFSAMQRFMSDSVEVRKLYSEEAADIM